MSWHKVIRYYVSSQICRLREWIQPSRITDANDIPIIINNFNRLTTLRMLIERLERANCRNIHIIDNASTYPPLLSYYDTLPYTVHRLNENLGFKALWRSGLNATLCRDYFVYTDSDVVPLDECPDDFMQKFLDVLKTRRLARKVGFSLRIDNLPDHYAYKDKVIAHESRFFQRPTADGKMYRAPIDTTFAMYRPRIGLSRSFSAESYRMAYPYQAEHLPWYNDLDNLSDEELYYIQHTSQVTEWTGRVRQAGDSTTTSNSSLSK